MNQEKAGKDNHYGYNSRLQPFARANRNGMTKAEACLWKYVLRAGMMKGYGFRRQRPVLNYIADFMCKELMLIIEVDGFTHQFEETIKKDKIRQQRLEEAGFIVLRFTDDNVLHSIENVRQQILFTVETIEKRRGISSPVPPQGEG
ncbi:MAG: endonuclease domain-containing protein [Bacteroidota bacterium]